MYLITGANGFVGRALIAELTRRGLPFRAASRSAREGHVAVGEIGADTDWRAALEGVDAVIHLAARVHVMDRSLAEADAEFWPVNVDGSVNLMRKAREAGVRRLVYLSSIKVNGETTDGRGPFTADEAPNPQDAYGRSKLEAERGLLGLAAGGGTDVAIIRPPLVYGPGVKANFASMMKVVRRGIPLPLGAVRNARSLVYTGNLADLIITAATHPGAANEVFLAGDGEDLSTAGLLRGLAEAMGVPSRLVSVPPALLRAGAAAIGKSGVADRLLGSLAVDIRKTRERLGWTPPYSVAEGLHETVRT
ncbi:MAG TPA: SDR family oxidoreductase [Devosia sp.]|nr:SDR family oxidoreductase [Devosia sp.]